MVRFRAPANVLLQRAQLTLMLATLLPTVLMTALGIVQLSVGSGSINLVLGILLLTFCTTSLTGYILGSIMVSRGASLAKVQNDFVSSVSHELRTPLTSIRIFIDTLREDRLTDPEEKRKCLDLLYREVERLDGLVARVIELSRLETGRRAFEQNPVAIEDVAKDAVAAFKAATLSQPVDVEQHVENGLQVIGDRSTLALAVTNLLVNAWKYTPKEGKQIVLTARGIGQEVELAVKDNGCGIPKEEQRLIFEQFERGQGAIDLRTHGSGLGLAIVKAILNAHKGSIDVKSEVGQGAEFTIRLKRRAPGARA
jgi:two-component system, OmpR family, phosphate regulon sensor histidine kinase PhoR